MESDQEATVIKLSNVLKLDAHQTSVLRDAYLPKLQKRPKASARGHVSPMIEPFTAAWVASAIAAGMLSWVGSKLMDSIFGNGQDQLGINLARLLEQAIQQLEKFIGRALERQTLNEVLARLEALQIRITHYNNAPSDDRLFAATSSAEEVEAQLRSLGLVAHDSYLVALGIHLVVLQEREKRFGASERANICETLARGITHAQKLQSEWEPWERGLHRITAMPFHAICWWSLYRDDVEVLREIGDTYCKTQPISLQSRIDQAVAESIEAHVRPSEGIVAKWRELSQSAGCTNA